MTLNNKVMTVQELIDELSKIEDKNKEVWGAVYDSSQVYPIENIDVIYDTKKVYLDLI